MANTKTTKPAAADAFELTWTDAHGHEHQLCTFCGVDCSTHPDAGNPLTCCGDCGRATCPDHRVDDRADRCVECAATFYAEPTPAATTPRASRRYQTCAHSSCTQPARVGFTMCAGHAAQEPKPEPRLKKLCSRVQIVLDEPKRFG